MVKKLHSNHKKSKGASFRSAETIEDRAYSYNSDTSIQDVNRELVRDWMTPNPISVRSDSSLIDAIWLMIERNISRLPVVNHVSLVGLVTLGDIRCAIPLGSIRHNLPTFKESLSGLTVEEIMTPNPVTISQDAWLVDAARLMLENEISTLPVVESDVVVGIITESDIFRGMVELCAE